MIGNILEPIEDIFSPKPLNPLKFFNENNVCSEEDFIKILEAGIYTTDIVGYYVTLSNSVNYNNGAWVIADVNFKGNTNTYDLISNYNIGVYGYFSYDTSRDYGSSDTIRPYMINFGNGFSSTLKSHIIPIYSTDYAYIPDYSDACWSYTSIGSLDKGGNWWASGLHWSAGSNEAMTVQNNKRDYSTSQKWWNHYYVSLIRVS